MFAEDFAPIQSPVDELYGTGGTGYENWSVGFGFADDPVLQAFLGLEAGQTTFEFLYDPFDPLPGHGGHVPGDGFLPDPNDPGYGDDDNVVIVTGQRNTIYLSDLLDLGMTLRDLFEEVPTGLPDVSDGGSSDDKSQEEDPASDCELSRLKEEINAKPDSDSMEYGGLQYDNGKTSDSFGGVEPNRVPSGLYFDQIAADGMQLKNVTGVIHNHHETSYAGDSRFFSAFPSAGDWDFAEDLIDFGANSNLTLFVIDADGVMRGFSYADRAIYDEPRPEDFPSIDDWLAARSEWYDRLQDPENMPNPVGQGDGENGESCG